MVTLWNNISAFLPLNKVFALLLQTHILYLDCTQIHMLGGQSSGEEKKHTFYCNGKLSVTSVLLLVENSSSSLHLTTHYYVFGALLQTPHQVNDAKPAAEWEKKKCGSHSHAYATV